jgi:multidrug efflux pump subunit AcrA (membrane-fusion protein)
MRKLFTGICLVIILILVVGIAGCSAKTTVSNTVSTAEIKRGNLQITVSSDGNLVMPQAFDLKFGAPGNVDDVFVQEGDYVKQGTILATLDSSSEQLDIKAANCNLQQTLSNMYENIPSIQTTYTYPSFYPNASAKMASNWALEEIAGASDLYMNEHKDEAISKLSAVTDDLQSCIAVFQDTINNPQLGWDQKTLDSMDEFHTLTYLYQLGKSLVPQWQDIIKQINTCQDDIKNLQDSITNGENQNNLDAFKKISKEVDSINIRVQDNVNRIKIQPDDMSYPSKDLCLYLYDTALKKMDDAIALVEQGQANSPKYNDDLNTADHCMQMCNSIMGSSYLVLEHGLSLNSYQQNKLNISNLLVAMDNSRDNLLNTIIVAPFDGTVVSVGVKKNDILSAIDYSSKTAVQLVDTKDIHFEGLVDEIDILKVHTGQKAQISIDAVPNKVFTGTVTFISPYGTESTNNVVKFNVTVSIDPTDVELKGGLSATADISVYTAENVLLVPLSAVTFAGNKTTVDVVTGVKGKIEQSEITLGSQNFSYAEVLSGLNEGDVVQVVEKAVTAPVVTAPPAGPPPGR